MPTTTQVGIGPVESARWSLSLWLLAGLVLSHTPHSTAQTKTSDSSVESLKKLSLEQLLELEVTSVSKRPEKLSETASAIQVVTSEDVRRSGATSLAESLRLASNLQVAQIDSRQWAISARGFNGSSANKLLVLMDGRTLYSPLHAAVFWDVQDTLLEDLDRIEVISGPGATQWGANAVNGVINITTKNAKDTQGLLITAGGGTQLRGFGGMRYGGELAPDTHYRVYGKYFDRARTDFADGRGGANEWRMLQGGFRIDRTAGDNQLTLQGDVYDGEIGQPTAGDVRVKGANVLGRWSRAFSADSGIAMQWYYDRTYRRIPGTFAESLDTYDVDFQHHFTFNERHGIVWGLGYRVFDDRQHNDYPLLAFLPAEVVRELFSAFAQDEIQLIPERLRLTVGAKLEHNYYTGFEFQPSIRLAWRVNERQTLWAAVSRAVRMPSRIDGEFFAPRDPPFTLLQGNPDFKSEELIAYELGWRALPQPRLSLTAALFHHEYDKLRSIERLSPPASFPIYLDNLQEGTSTGAELTVEYQVTDAWRLRAGYTHLRIDLHNRPESTAVAPLVTDPEHQFSLRSALDLPGNVEFDVDYRYVSRLEGSRVPAYDSLDFRIGWNASSKLEISLVGQNVLQEKHAEFNPASSRQEIIRNVYGKITWRF